MSQTTVSAAKSVKVNTVVIKGNIGISSRGGLQVVASNEPDNAGTTAPQLNESSRDVNSELPTASWLQEPTGAVQQPAPPSDPQIATEPSMKMIKLFASAAALGVAAIVLAFMQFSGSKTDTDDARNTPAQVSSILNAAVASTLKASIVTAPEEDQNSSDLVAQITAGTLAALRTGSAKLPADTPERLSQAPTETSGNIASSEEPNALYAMVLHAVQQGQSTKYIDQMVNEAYRTEKVAVPEVLLTASGEVDTKALLTLFVGN